MLNECIRMSESAVACCCLAIGSLTRRSGAVGHKQADQSKQWATATVFRSVGGCGHCNSTDLGLTCEQASPDQVGTSQLGQG